MNTRYQTIFFKISAYWNFGWGLAILFAHSYIFAYLGVDITADPVYVACAQLAGMSIALFGVGYYLVSISIERYQALCWLGVVGKVGTFVVFINHYLSDPTMLPLALAGTGDLIFAVLFVRELRALGKMNPQVPVNKAVA